MTPPNEELLPEPVESVLDSITETTEEVGHSLGEAVASSLEGLLTDKEQKPDLTPSDTITSESEQLSPEEMKELAEKLGDQEASK